MSWHNWKYKGYHDWICEYCKGKTKNPNIGSASRTTCPGIKKRK